MPYLSLFLVAYILISLGIGVYAAMRVRNASDFMLAGRSLPIYVIIATVFATWFGSEAIFGIPAIFAQEGLAGIVSDPFGAGFCLVFVGVFFAARLYRMKLLTIGDFYRKRYGRTVEMIVSIAICISYLGWVSAQIVALGLVINIVSFQAVSFEFGMVLGLVIVLLYTIIGGMWAVALTDFIQMVVIFAGLAITAWLVANRIDGGAIAVVQDAYNNDRMVFWPDMNMAAILGFIGAFITLALGSIPQQDVFQRVMSSKNEFVSVWGTVIGGVLYMVFCFVPIFIVYAAGMIDPEFLSHHLSEGGDSQRILPEFILNEMPLAIQIIFFGALLSAIMSTASGTLLAPSSILAENIIKEHYNLSDKQLLITTRLCVFVFGLIVLAYAYFSASAGLTIFEMVENAYLITLCVAFVPLAAGVYWKKANNFGAMASIIAGGSSWAVLEGVNIYLTIQGQDALIIPPQLAGVTISALTMIAGSYIGERVFIKNSVARV